MKTIKQFFILIFVVLVVRNLNAQELTKVKADTIRIKFETCLLEVSTFDLKAHSLQQAQISEKLNLLLREIEKMEFNLPSQNAKLWVKYAAKLGGEEVEFSTLEFVSEENKSKKVVIQNGDFLETDFGNLVLEVEDNNYLIRLYLKNLNDAQFINLEEFNEKIRAADNEIPESRKKTNTWLIENTTGTFNSYFVGESSPFTLDMLELNAGVSTGIIKNQFVSGFNFRLGFAFAKKGIMKNKYFADYEVFYDFSNPTENNPFEVNGFLSLGYMRNFSLDPQKAKWYGISLGYLVDRNSNFFEKNTLKLAVHKQISNSIILKPEIYFEGFFKKSMPGLGVQITF